MSPPTIPRRADLVILGAGPAGIEAALAAREHGFEPVVLEADTVGASLHRWGHVRLFTSWALNLSDRGREALLAAGQPVPAADKFPTGREVVTSYLQPLADGPLQDHVFCGTRALAVSRGKMLKGERIGDPARCDQRFRVVWRRNHKEGVLETPILIDATGVYQTPTATGAGGVAAPGERDAAAFITRHIPDVLAVDANWSGRLMVIGSGYSAATVLHDLQSLAQRDESIHVTWLLRGDREEPLRRIADDPLPQRQALTEEANALAARPPAWLTVERNATVEAFASDVDDVTVTYQQQDELRTCTVDRVISLTGYRPDPELLRELQVHHCWATDGLMKLSAELLGAASGGDCLAQGSGGAATLLNPEPNLFVIGNKSYGRLSTYLLRSGREQIEHVFTTLLSQPEGQRT
ncbi:MAG: NAD(P)-binding domain-containing protein [Planctomycetota bacterium]